MTEDRSEQQDQPSRPERRGERRIKSESYQDWLHTLREQVKKDKLQKWK